MDTAGSLGAARTGARDRDATMSVATSVVATLAPSRLRAPSPAPRRGRRAHCVFRRWVRHASSAPTPAPTRRVAAPGASCVAFAATGPARRRASARASAADARLAAPASSADDEGEDARVRDPTETETRAEGCSDDAHVCASSESESEERSPPAAPDESSDAASDGFKELVKFTLPTMAIWMCGPILSMVDTAVVGTASTLELAAMTPGGVFVDYPAYLIASSLATATTTLVARDRLIKNKHEAELKTEKTIADGIALASIGGVLLAVFLRFVANDTVANFAGPASAAVVPPALRYATARLWGVPAAMIVAVAQASFLACKAPKQPLLAVAVAAVANLAGDLFLVVAAGWGIAGAAWATVAAQASMSVALVVLLLRGGRPATEKGFHKRKKTSAPPRLNAFPLYVPKWKDTFRFLTIAGPVFYLNAIKIIFVAGLVQSVTAIGPECAAASGVLSAVYFFFAVMGDGVSQAAQTFLPPSLGTKRAVKVSVLLLVSAACLGVFNGVVSCVIAVAAPQIFTNSEVVANIMRNAAPVMSFALAIHTASMGSEGCLLAARDVRFMSFWYLPNSLFAYVTLIACLTQMGVADAGGAFGDFLAASGGFGKAFGIVGDVSAKVLTSLGIVGASGAGGAAALWASMAHFNFMRLALNIGRMFLAGFSGKRGSPLLRPP
jgi:Na+-driven multidrug efflux pump